MISVRAAERRCSDKCDEQYDGGRQPYMPSCQLDSRLHSTARHPRLAQTCNGWILAPRRISLKPRPRWLDAFTSA